MERTHSAIFERLTKASVPDISKLPDDALLSRKQLAGLTGYTEQSFKVWAKSGKGPATIYVEGRPRTTVRAYREWISGGQRASA